MTNPYNNEFKKQVISSLYFDFLILPEIHCLPNQIVEIENNKIVQHNRPNQGNARRCSGGIAIAVHCSALESHFVLSVNKCEDGQMSLKLKNVNNDFLIGILALYLLSDNYIYGWDPETFFNNASVLWEDLYDCDLLLAGSDVNSRTTDLVHFLPDVDSQLIPTRGNPDRAKNKQSNSFITHL